MRICFPGQWNRSRLPRPRPAAGGDAATRDERIAQLEADVAALRQEVAALRQKMDSLGRIERRCQHCAENRLPEATPPAPGTPQTSRAHPSRLPLRRIRLPPAAPPPGRAGICSCFPCGWFRPPQNPHPDRAPPAALVCAARLTRCISMRDAAAFHSAQVRECLRVEVRVQFAVEPHQQIAVEGRGHAGRIVIGRQQRGLVLHQIHAEQKAVAGLEPGAHPPQQFRGFAAAQSCRCWSRCRAPAAARRGEAGQDGSRARRRACSPSRAGSR